MITLGLGKIIFGRKNEDPQAIVESLPPAFRQALFEAVTWCSTESLPESRLRSIELDPAAMLATPSFDELGIDAWSQAKRESYQRAVSAMNERRAALLLSRGIAIPHNPLLDLRGKLFCYEPQETVEDGASEAASRGFFDGEDAPPWDTWLYYADGAIFSWVPETLINEAQAGIDANAVDCMRWIKWSDLSRTL